MTNHITVIANGAPGSFVRRVQEQPMIAVELLHALKRLLVRAKTELADPEDVPEIQLAIIAIAKAETP